MGLFGFGKKKDKKETEPAVEPDDEDTEQILCGHRG